MHEPPPPFHIVYALNKPDTCCRKHTLRCRNMFIYGKLLFCGRFNQLHYAICLSGPLSVRLSIFSYVLSTQNE